MNDIVTFETQVEKAFALWYQTLSVEKVSRALGVPVKTLNEWAKRYDWASKAREIAQELQDHWRRQIAAIQSNRAGDILGETLSLLERLQRVLARKLAELEKGDGALKDIKDLVRVLKEIADVVDRLVLPHDPKTQTYVDNRKVALYRSARPVSRVELMPVKQEGTALEGIDG